MKCPSCGKDSPTGEQYCLDCGSDLSAVPLPPGRKVGHVTALGSDLATVRERARRAARYLAAGTEEP